MNSPVAFVGTYSEDGSDGIYHYLILEDGSLERLGTTAAGNNPSFLAIHPDGTTLYAVNEVENGTVTALSLDRESGAISRINQRMSGASGPCHCTVNSAGNFLLVAHYTGGTVSVLSIREDGGIDGLVNIAIHEGSGIHPQRQTQAHPHSICLGPHNRFVYVPDLGTDEVVVYEFDEGELWGVGEIPVRQGAGPRHIAFHPGRPIAFLINELDSTIAVYNQDESTGLLSHYETESTLPDGYDDENVAADIHVHPSGKWVYGSNRGHDSIVIFEVKSGGLRSIGHESTHGHWPRNFAIDPTGRFLYAENQRSNEIILFRIDKSSGQLDHTGSVAAIPQPVCMQILDV